MIHRLRRRLILLATTAVLLAIPAATGGVHRMGPTAPAQVLSGLEAAGNASIGRDCGYSQPLVAGSRRSLWLFCDTPVYQRRHAAGDRFMWTLERFINGSTAALGPGAAGRVPGRLTEVPTPDTGNGLAAPRPHTPSRFLPTPAGLVTLAGQPCESGGGSYAASWISGVTRIPSSADLLITFNDYCVLTSMGPRFVHEGFGLVEYDPTTNTLSNEVRVFTGLDLVGALALGSPIFSGRYLYLFSPVCTVAGKGACAAGNVSVARVGAMPLDWADPLGYQWWTGGRAGAWTSNAAAAGSVIKGAAPYAVSVEDFFAAGHRLVLVEQTDISGRFNVYESPTPTGAWVKIQTGRVPCGPSRGGNLDFCRAIIGHPDLSTRSRLALSYFDPGASVHGHVMVQDFPW